MVNGRRGPTRAQPVYESAFCAEYSCFWIDGQPCVVQLQTTAFNWRGPERQAVPEPLRCSKCRQLRSVVKMLRYGGLFPLKSLYQRAKSRRDALYGVLEQTKICHLCEPPAAFQLPLVQHPNLLELRLRFGQLVDGTGKPLTFYDEAAWTKEEGLIHRYRSASSLGLRMMEKPPKVLPPGPFVIRCQPYSARDRDRDGELYTP